MGIDGGSGGFTRTMWECDPTSATFACDDLTLGCPMVTYPEGAFFPAGLTARYGHRAVATASSMFVVGGMTEDDCDDAASPEGGGEVFRLDVSTCKMVALSGGGFPGGTRAHHVAGVTAAGEIYVHGGMVNGAPDPATLRLAP